jgi:ubiquinone/menaquinone biosynthesis C-methylase UbiE
MTSDNPVSRTADSAAKSVVHSTWEKAAPGWAKWEREFSAGLSAATDMLIDMAGIRPGMRVLDMACGAGSQTIHAAKRVGPSGSVVACDISATMLDHVRQSAAAARLQIETLECPAEELDERLPPFDAAISRLGLMLFLSPSNALKALQRVLKPGARFAALVFTTPDNNPFLSRSMAIVLRCAGKSPPKPGQPGLFALGGNRILEDLMRDSGLVQVQTKLVTASLNLPSASHALEMMQEAFGAYRAVLADLGDAEKSKAWNEVYECLKEFEGADGFVAQFEFVIGAGAKAA